MDLGPTTSNSAAESKTVPRRKLDRMSSPYNNLLQKIGYEFLDLYFQVTVMSPRKCL